jgi:CRISPR-associated Cas5-like protein
MLDPERTRIEFRTWGRYALFTDPVTRVGGEKCSYHIPTYEALKGVAKETGYLKCATATSKCLFMEIAQSRPPIASVDHRLTFLGVLGPKAVRPLCRGAWP